MEIVSALDFGSSKAKRKLGPAPKATAADSDEDDLVVLVRFF